MAWTSVGVGVWVRVGIWVLLSTPTLATLYKIIPDKKMVTSPMMEAPVANTCVCRLRCQTLPGCVAWSAFVRGDQLTCRLADVVPQQTNLMSDTTAVTGCVPTTTGGGAEPMSEASSPDTTAAPPTTTELTTTITTTTTPSTTNTVPMTYDNKVENHNSCSADRGVTVVSLKPYEQVFSDIDWIVCTRPIQGSTNFEVTGNEELKSTGPDSAAECSQNSVVVGIKGYNNMKADMSYDQEDKNWDNSLYMFIVCQPLTTWTMTSDCEVVNRTSGVPWNGWESIAGETTGWTDWFLCSEGYIAVQITRAPRYGERGISSMKCCKVAPPPM